MDSHAPPSAPRATKWTPVSTVDDDLLAAIRSHEPIESTDDAREGLAAVMETVGERITEGQAEDLAATLPDAAATPLRAAQDGDPQPAEAEPFSSRNFLERVADRADVDAEPLPLTRAVLAEVRTAADDAELERTRDQLPGQFDYFFEPGEPTSAAAFLDAVDDRLPADTDPRTATNAVLETLAERVTGGEAVDLATYLPRELRDPLLDADEDAETFDPETFLERVADRADVDDDEARAVARAATATVGETAPAVELENVRSQLPPEFDPLFDD